MEISESQDPNVRKYLNASEHYMDWPVVDEIKRAAGHTSLEVQKYIHKSVGSSPGDRLSQQYVTPDQMTARGIITVSKEMGAPREVLESVYNTLIELELYKANPVGEFPTPLSSYADVDVNFMREQFHNRFEGP